MNKQSLIIYNLPVLFNILNEIKENLKFDLYKIDNSNEILKLSKEKFGNYILLTNNESKDKNNNRLIIENFPLKINQIIEKININFLKNKYNDQSEITVGQFKLNFNSREIFDNNKKLKLTEREIDIILYLKNSDKAQSVNKLQKEVWGHNSDLETHTVETHIYRLRKKINDTFKNEKFLISTKNGYKIG